MKKKVIWIVLAVLLVGIALFVFVPRPLLGKDTVITSVYYQTEDVTEKVDADELIEILSDGKSVFSVRATGNYWINDYPLEINLGTKGTSLHIVMGKRHYAYDRHWNLARTIKNGDELYEKILELIK